MTIETDLIALLESNDITVYIKKIPTDGTYPSVVMQRISSGDFRTHNGVEFETPRIQLTSWAKTYKAAVEQAEAIKTILDLNQSDFKLSYKEAELDAPTDLETDLHGRILDFFIWK